MSGREENLSQILRSVYGGNCCRVLGPRHHNKSALMRQVAETLEAQKTHYAIYLALDDVQRNNEASFYTNLFDFMQGKLPDTFKSGRIQRCESAIEYQQALIAWSRHSDRNLALLIDSLEMAPPNLAASLLGALRAAYTTVVTQSGAHFQAIVCGSLNLNQVALANASRFESISDLVLVMELDEEERVELARRQCREAGITPTNEGLQALLAHTGGDPFLIQAVTDICFQQMQQSNQTRLTQEQVTEAVRAFLGGPTPWAVVEALRQIEINPSLLTCALRLLDHGTTPVARLPIDGDEMPTVLDLCSAFHRVGNSYQVKSLLWDTLLRQHLTPARVGGLYAIAGNWKAAIEYLGTAVQTEHSESIPELFAATINAIHASADVGRAWRQLGQGLQALYPASDVQLYTRVDAALRRVYPPPDGNERLILLEDAHLPEVEALGGPDYSVAKTAVGTRLLFPLRASRPGKHAIGLATFRSLIASDSPYAQQETRMRLAGFLWQAARAIQAKTTYRAMLDATTHRGEKLNTLNQILTDILNHRTKPEERLLRVILEGITHGWGLEFNRAMLFVPDEEEQHLIGHLVIGHSTRKEAEADWEKEPYDRQTLQEWLSTLFLAQEAIDQPGSPQAPLQTIKVPLTMADDPLVQCYHRRTPLRSSQLTPLFGFSPDFDRVVEPPADFAITPLRAGERTLGVIYVDNRFTGRAVSTENYELMQTFVNQSALIIESARALERRTQELTGLSRELHAGLKSPSDAEIEDVVRSALQTAHARTGAQYLYLIRNEPFDKWRVFRLTASQGLEWEDVDSPPSDMLQAEEQKDGVLCIRSRSTEARQEINFFHEDARCGIEMPVVVTDNCLALLHLESSVRKGLTADHLEQLRHVTSRLTLTLTQIERIQALRQLVDISLQLTRENALDALLISIVERVMWAMRTVSAITLYYVEQTSNQLLLAHAAGIHHRTDVSQQPPYRRTVIDEIWQLDDPIFSSHVREHPLLNGPFVQRESIVSAAAFPLLVNEARVGCMFFNYRIHHIFDDGEQNILSLVAQLAAVAIHQAHLNEEIQQRKLWQGISRLSTGMIHDISGAVANIPDLINEIEQNLNSGNEVAAPLADLRRNAEKTAQLSDHLREYIIQQQFRSEPIELQELVSTLLSEVEGQLPRHVTLDPPDTKSLPKIWADPFLLTQLLRNLIQNAWEAIPPERQGVIDIRVRLTGQKAIISIKDNGRGIVKAHLHRIFDPDYTTKTDRLPMHGIGLSYCKEIAREHSGELLVESRPGEGSIFTVELPAENPTRSHHEQQTDS